MDQSQDKALLSDIFQYLLNKWKTIVLVVFLAGALAFVYSYFAPHSYTAETTVLPPIERSGGGGLSSIMASVGKDIPFGMLGGGSNSTEYYLDIIQSRSIARDICIDLDIFNNPMFKELDSLSIINIVRSTLDADFEMSGLMIVSSRVFTDYFPEEEDKDEAKKLSAAIAESAITQLNSFLIDRERNKAKETRTYIEGELDKYNSKLDTIAILFEEFQSNNKLLSLDDQTQATISQASQLASEIAITQAELALAKITYSDQSREVLNLKQQLKTLESQYRNAQSGGVSSSDQFSLPLSKIPNLARRYAILYRDREVLEQVILFLETQKHQEAIQETKDVAQIEVLDYPITPNSKTSPSRIFLPVGAGIIAGFITLLVLMINAYRKGKALA